MQDNNKPAATTKEEKVEAKKEMGKDVKTAFNPNTPASTPRANVELSAEEKLKLFQDNVPESTPGNHVLFGLAGVQFTVQDLRDLEV